MKFSKPVLGLLIAVAANSSINADNLSQIYQLSLTNDPVLQAAEAVYLSGQERAIQARAALLPSLNAQYSYSETDTTLESSQPTVDTDNTTKQLSLALEQKLFDLNAWFSFKGGQKLSQQAKVQFAADQQDLIVRVAEAYFEVLRAQDILASSKAEEKAIAQQLKQTKQRFEVGLVPMTDVHEATAAYDLSRVKRLADEGQLGIAYEALTVLTGQRHQVLQGLKDDYEATGPQPANVEAWVDLALKHNWALKAANLGTQSAQFNAKASKAGHYPTLDASISYSDSNDSSLSFGGAQLNDADTENTRIQLNLKLPLYNGGAVSSKRRQAYQDLYAAQAQKNGAQRNTVQATRSFFLAASTDAAQVKAQKQSIVSAQSAIDATQAGYEVGTRNVVDVLNAQRTLFAAKRDYATARYQYIIDSLKLKQQAGILSPADIKQLNAALY